MPTPLLKIKGLNKSYNAPVLADFDLEIDRGEIHALVGSNGAGKSTLAKILCGLTAFSTGDIRLDGATYHPPSKQAATAAGVVMVMQELNTVSTLSVAENLFFHNLPRKFGIVSKSTLRANAKAALARINLESIDPDAPASELGVGQQQLIEIAAALTQDCKLLILDEPTAALTDPEIETLFTQMRELAKSGVAILYVSHRMEEIRRICNRVSVMRDGRRINTHNTDKVDNATVVREMSGADVWDRNSEARDLSRAPTVLEARKLSSDSGVRDLSIDLRQGEILGLAGLVGSGRTECLRLLFGADKRSGGNLRINGESINPQHPADCVKAGLGMIPEDRKSDGLLLPLSIRANACLAVPDLYSKRGITSRQLEYTATAKGCETVQVKMDHVEQAVHELSGGNQQKIVFLRWLLRDSSILLLDEPTRGIDVVAKASIYELLRQLAANGKSMIIVSSELLELMALCDRIAVISDGTVCAEFSPENWSQEAITQAAFSQYLNAS